MPGLQFTKSPSTLLRGAESLLILAPESRLRDGEFLQALPEELMRLALELVSDAPGGGSGATLTTLTGDRRPRRLTVGILPDRVSRHNSPSRAHAVRGMSAELGLSGEGRKAVLLALDDPEHYLPVANALGAAMPLFDARSGAGRRPTVQVLALGPEDEPIAPSKRLKATVAAAQEAARLVDSPPSEMNPKGFQSAAWKLVSGLDGVTKKSIAGDALARAGLGGLHAVGRCATESPRLLVLSAKGKGRSPKHVALVGKGITYDTGGLSLKVGGSMQGMKADMGGAAAVLGAFRALVEAGCQHRLTALLCMAENAIGPEAYKLDDVLTFHSGKTVEINNTDAEGRLALGDGVSYAARVLKADVILDAATLTGAQLIATGKKHAAVVTNDETLEELLVDAGRASGDLTHPLPFAPEFYKRELKSTIADMRNSVADRMNAQSSCAAQFIYWHVEDTDVRWGHIDMAGPAFIDRRATGYGVALLEEAVRRL